MAKSTQNIKNNIRWEINGLLLISFGVLGFFSIYTNAVGAVGRFISKNLKGFSGQAAVLIPILIILAGIYCLYYKKKPRMSFRIIGLIVIFSVVVFLFHLNTHATLLDMNFIERLRESADMGNEGIGGGILGETGLSLLKFYLPGIILQHPNKSNPTTVAKYHEQPKLSSIFRESDRWAHILGVPDVGALNDHITSGKSGEVIRIAEALHEKKIAQIADTISKDSENLRIILIAGPSSSGKTTFAQRLIVQLMVNGLRPISISLDDYFLDRDKTPLGDDGKPDFEALDAIEVRLFNQHLTRLIQGKEVILPRYNFHTGKREYSKTPTEIEKDQPIIIEGIHGLNERLTASIPKENKFKIYVSALTQLSIDNHNRISTTDTRLLRRIVRDSWSRSADAKKTISMWPAVLKGAEKNIFPYQEEADVMFNSALVYEMAVLKKYAEPLLKQIKEQDTEYIKAKHLLKFLEYFEPIKDEKDIPLTSIIREFVGNSCFYD
jgi:uridine kinase